MNYRKLGNTGLTISEVSFGTWAIGGDWGVSRDEERLRGLELAVELGVNFFDTADVYGSSHAVIPGFKNEAQVTDNPAASEVPSFSTVEMERLSAFYKTEVTPISVEVYSITL